MKTLKEVCDKIAEQTDENDHTGAKITCANYFGLKHYEDIFKLIENLHCIEGSLPEELSNYRLRKGKEMLNHIKLNFPNEFEQIYKSF